MSKPFCIRFICGRKVCRFLTLFLTKTCFGTVYQHNIYFSHFDCLLLRYYCVQYSCNLLFALYEACSFLIFSQQRYFCLFFEIGKSFFLNMWHGCKMFSKGNVNWHLFIPMQLLILYAGSVYLAHGLFKYYFFKPKFYLASV